MKAVSANQEASQFGKLGLVQGASLDSWVALEHAPAEKYSTESTPQRILIADDDTAICFALSKVFSAGGFEVATVRDGEAAWEALITGDHDLLVTDNEMPRLTGEALICRIRTARMRLPVVVYSGTFAEEDVHGRFDSPIAAILHKPCNSKTLLAAVRSALNFRFTTDGPGEAIAGSQPVRKVNIPES